jgi:signal transduction histidine kinase
MIIFMWGRRWSLPGQAEKSPDQPPPHLRERKFWEGSLFGVAINAQSFPGIIAVHAKADYILNFKKEIGVQHQIEELGRQPDIDYVALLDNQLKIVAHTDPSLVGTQDRDGFLLHASLNRQTRTRILHADGAPGRYELVKPIRLNNSPLGFLRIGLSLEPMEISWRRSLSSIIVLSLAILALGLLGMAAIFYNQQSHMERIRSLEAEVAQQERLSAMGNLAATVAHEIRNPLNAISMGLQRLKAEFRPTQDEDQYSRFIELTQSEVHRLNSIVEQFLSLARPLDLKPEALDVEAVLNELATFVEVDAKRSHVEINVKAAPHLPPLKADRNYLKQLLLNLILNGVQAMPEGGTLTLEAGRSNSHLSLWVTDTGIGIPEEMLPKIFEPYFTSKSNGSGLGLAIARRIAEAHGGTLTVESEVGNGSRFQASLPLEGPEK